MIFDPSQFAAAMPEIFILSMACVILMLDAFLPAKFRATTFYLIQGTLAVAFLMANNQFGTKMSVSFGGHYVLDSLAVTSKLFIYLFASFAFSYAKEYIEARKIPTSEYYLLGLFSILGMSIMVSAYSFLSIYLGLELLSLPLPGCHEQGIESNGSAKKYLC